MKAYSYIVGRGQYTGFGFFAATKVLPYNAPWIGVLQASDTLEHRPILEMHCVKYSQPVLISSQWVAEGRPFGYTEYLELELPEDIQQRQTFLDEPARMLYLDFMDTKAFLGLDREHGPGHATLDVRDIQFPTPPAYQKLNVEPAMMAALLTDVWANSFQRMLGVDISPLRLELTPVEKGSDTLDDGRAFVHQQLLPLLPPSVRHIISVRIGCFWSAVKRGAGSAALVISLPENSSWEMKGGYNLNTNKYQLRSPSDWCEFGEALMTNTHMDYYWALHKKEIYQPIAADFEVSYLLFRVHKLLHTGSLSDSVLSEATGMWFKLDKIITQGYKEISSARLRELLFGLESDLILAYTKVYDVHYKLSTYDALIVRAFSADAELKAGKNSDALRELKSNYIQALVQPKKIKEWAYLPCARLWMVDSLCTECLRNDPELYVTFADRCLKEHAYSRPLPWEQLNKLLNVFRAMKDPWQQLLGRALADYAGNGVANDFLITDVQGIREALADIQPDMAREVDEAAAQQFERLLLSNINQTGTFERFMSFGKKLPPEDSKHFSSDLRERLCKTMQNPQNEESIGLQLFIEICNLFSWMQYTDVQDAFLLSLSRRGLRGDCYLTKDEIIALNSLLANAGAEARQRVKQALDPMAANMHPKDEMLITLGNLLPQIITSPIRQPLTGGWQLAYNRRLLEALYSVLKQSYGNPQVLVKPREAWNTVSPFAWLKLESLDELTYWHLDQADMVACVQKPLDRTLQDSTVPMLLTGITANDITQGWFGTLLQDRLKMLLSYDRIRYYLEGCKNYRHVAALESLCNLFFTQPIYADFKEALAFVVNRQSQDARILLDQFTRLRRKDIAGDLLRVLTDSDDRNPWNTGRWDDILLTAYITRILFTSDRDANIFGFLDAIGVDLDQLHSLHPWDKGEGSSMLSLLVYTFYWLESMELYSIAEILQNELAQEKRFMRRLYKNGAAKKVFAPALTNRQREADSKFPVALKKLLNAQ